MASCWIEVDLGCVRENYRALKTVLGPEIDIIAVVKADAYGLGALETGRVLSEEGARYLAVTRIEEAQVLRQGGISAPILMLAPAPHEDVDALLELDITACLNADDDIEQLQNAAQRHGKIARCGLKINTGMNRFGFVPGEAPDAAQRIASSSHLQLETCWTHLMDAGETKPLHVHEQYGRFAPLISSLGRITGLTPHDFHCANSSTILRFPALRLSCVRAGTILFGQFPGPQARVAGENAGLKLRDPFGAKARVLALQNVKAGDSVGYGGEWTAKRASRIATLGIGFADGLMQQPQTRPTSAMSVLSKAAREAGTRMLKGANDGTRRVWWNAPNDEKNVAAQIIGRVAMQSCLIDVTDLPQIKIGDVFSVSLRRTSAGAHLQRVYR